jgi:hypothetical protein
MEQKSPSVMRHVVTSLKVVAVVTVLGTVVLAAERHMSRQVSPEEVIATDLAPARTGPPMRMMTAPTGQPAAAQAAQDVDYLPSHFDESKGEVTEQPSTF